ncbi:penicillin-binding transpeptidase domain-containing protein [Paenibacillus sp. LHD-117]|uniref:peptidoglycan D,D-transpeptidase FtsI family protein n=1 Tax=Paenibacillus sp. LHD-117 TaxID=3071412 RepID=UPI0027DF0FEE|nr:penicillin-binding transpeptidase domain-containing protein [Paenibacillus sp. LHD-117]MDQ6419833.1 penicillin-binding transpeptidase domain-containing protein [Paenibacillus sp. LHD-117]
MQDDPQKREIDNRRNFSFRLNFFFFITFGLFSLLIVRLAVLQFVEGPTLSAEGLRKSTRNDAIAPIRGNIYDANGYPIAYSTSTQSLYYSIQPGKGYEDKAKATAKQLVEIFTQYGDPKQAMTEDDIIRQMDLEFGRNTISTPRRIKSGLTKKEVAYFMENRTDFTGVDIMEESVRNYDKSSIAVQLVGYLKKYKGVRVDNEFYSAKMDETDPALKYLEEEEVGLDGLEFMYQDVLRGKNGLKSYPVNNQEQIIGPMQITNPEKGADLFLTINKNIQLHTEQSIMNHLEKIRKSTNRYEKAEFAQTGFAVAMEVDTGKVVAMASMPDYNPNIWAGGRISPEDYENFSNVLPNGTIRTVYGPYKTKVDRDKHPSSIVPPGSTMKPLSVLIGLQEGLFSPTTRYNDTGLFTYGSKGYETNIRNSQNKSYGSIDGAGGIAHSSNPFMAAMIGNKLYLRGTVNGKSSVEIWDGYMKQFGLGVSTESGLPGESRGIIEYFTEAERGSAQSALIQASFGQQGRYTTLQLAQYTAMLANRGKRIKPQFVNEIKDSEGNLIQGYTPEILNTVDIPEAYWKEIETGMEQVNVQGFEGFGHEFRRKTGTSEQDVSQRTAENAVFIAYAPADNPKLAVAVIVPDGGFGGYGAAPIARQIFDAYDAEIGLTGTPNKALAAQLAAASAGGAAGGTNADGTPIAGAGQGAGDAQ